MHQGGFGNDTIQVKYNGFELVIVHLCDSLILIIGRIGLS
jgi:hypothetical protein